MDFELTDDRSSITGIAFNVPGDLLLFPKFPVQCVRVTGAFGELLFYEFTSGGISFRYSIYQMKLHSFLKARADQKILELRIALKNQILGIWDGLSDPSLAEGRFSLGFTPQVQTKAEFQEDTSYTTCDFHFEYSFLIEMASDFPVLSEFMEQIEQNKAVQVHHPSLICSQSMMDAVRYIQNNPFSEKSQKHIFVHRAKEILLSALEIMSDYPADKPIILDARLIEALTHARDFIEKNFDEELSLNILCRESALSLFVLKKGFKTLFGTTPMEYQIQLKMKWAKELILSGEYTITEVAYKLGYHFVSNFTLEFKRRFGYTPSYFKKYGRMR